MITNPEAMFSHDEAHTANTLISGSVDPKKGYRRMMISSYP